MSRGRDNEAAAVIGFNGEGKSSLVMDIVREVYDLRSQKIVILNSTNPIVFQKLTYVDNVEKLRKGWHGIVRFDNPNSDEETLWDVYNLAKDGYLSNGAVVFDDCTNYINANPQKEIKKFLVNRRMYNLDIFFTTHSLAMLPKFCRSMVNSVTVFKTGEVFENPRELRELNYPNYTEIYNAWKEVMRIPKDRNKFIQANRTIATGV